MGEFTDDELDTVELHLAECDHCCEQLALLAELGEDVPGMLPMEMPSPGFVDRVMNEIAALEEADRSVVVPLQRRRSPRMEFLTRFVTAAAVTGLMVFGTTQVQAVPVLDELSAKVGETESAVKDSTQLIYMKLQGLIESVSINKDK
jgi:anti-sigma factor RsiW